MTSCRKVSNNKRGRYTDNLCGIHGIQVYASSEFTTAFRFTLFESAKAIVQLVNMMKMESSGFGLALMRITTNFYLNGNKLARCQKMLSVYILPMTDTNHKNGNLLIV